MVFEDTIKRDGNKYKILRRKNGTFARGAWRENRRHKR
jgi:hypothetical protein